MSIPLRKNIEELPSVDGTRLRRGRVMEAEDDRVRLIVPEGEVWAVMALGYRYEPAKGDLLLVAGDDGEWFVIGVLVGTGRSTFTAPGDLELNAPRGRIDLAAAKGIRLRSPIVQLVSGKLLVVAKAAVERYGSLRQRVRDALNLRARRVQIKVESTHRLKAGRIVQRAEGDVKLDGSTIRLG